MFICFPSKNSWFANYYPAMGWWGGGGGMVQHLVSHYCTQRYSVSLQTSATTRLVIGSLSFPASEL